MIVSIDPAARSRLNTAHIVCNFIGGAIGSTLAAVLWQVGQWPAVMGGSAVVVAFALTLWFIHRKRALSECTQPLSTSPATEGICSKSRSESRKRDHMIRQRLGH